MTELKEYVSHQGTIRIAGSTVPKRAGKCAYHFLQKRINPIEFFCMGAGANQQATKSMGVFLHIFEQAPENEGMSIAFQPYRYRTSAKDADSSIMRDKDCTVWKTVLIDRRK
jgi:hypothetical protein